MFHTWEYDKFIEHVSPNGAPLGLTSVLGLLSSTEFGNPTPLNMENGPWLAGGALRSVVERSKRETDYDIFFKSKEQHESVREWLAESQGMGYRYSTNLRCDYLFTKTFEADHLTNYKLQLSNSDVEYKVQLIHGDFFHIDAETLLSSFDFTICQLVTDGRQVVVGNSTLYDIAERKLVIAQVMYPVASMKRMMKYARYGYDICNGEATKFLQAVANDPQIVETRFRYVD